MATDTYSDLNPGVVYITSNFTYTINKFLVKGKNGILSTVNTNDTR